MAYRIVNLFPLQNSFCILNINRQNSASLIHCATPAPKAHWAILEPELHYLPSAAFCNPISLGTQKRYLSPAQTTY